MTTTDAKSFAGVLTVPRSRLSIFVAIGAMALFLTAASLLLASYPVTISPQQDIVIKQPTPGGTGGGTEPKSGSAFGTELSNNGRKDDDNGSGVDSGSDGRKEGGTGDGSGVKRGSASGVGTGDGSEEAKSGSESGADFASQGRKDAGVGDDDDNGSGVDIGSDGRKEGGTGDGSGVKSGSASGVGSGDGSEEAKSGSESGPELASEGRKDAGVGDDSSEVKSGSNGRSDAGVGEGGKEPVIDDGSVSVNGDGVINFGKENSSSSSENESEKVSSENDSEKAGSGTQDDGSAPLDAAKEATVSPSESEIDSATTSSKSCDLYQGKWIYDQAGPLYTNNTCPIITQMQNCQGNLRPDKEYENYRWKPDQCDLPRFSPRKFLELMRGKTLAFIGDSVARNQMEYMLCILWQEETPKNRGNRRMQRWYFRSTSTMIVRIWSSWLVHQDGEPVDFAPRGFTKVHLDIPDETFMEFLPSFDVVVLSSGHWFAKKSAYVLNNKVVGGQLWWPKNAGKMKVNNIDAFGISVETSMTAIANNPNFTGIAIVRSYSPDHYEGGAWNTGGSCTGKIKPLSEVVRNGFTDVMHEKQVTGFRQAVTKSGSGGAKLKLMDITDVFGYRADGHPGPYRSPDPNKKTKRGPHGEPPPQDCLHWCMPGPVDTWNEILLEMIRREYEGA